MTLYITDSLCVELGLRKLLGKGQGYGKVGGLALFAEGKPEAIHVDMSERIFRIEYRTFEQTHSLSKWLWISEKLDMQKFRALASAVCE